MPARECSGRRRRRRCSRRRFMVRKNSVTARNGNAGRSGGTPACRRFCAAHPLRCSQFGKKQERPWRRNLFVPGAAMGGGWKRAGPASLFPARGAARPPRPGNVPGARPVLRKNGWRPVPTCLTRACLMPALLPPRGAYPHPPDRLRQPHCRGRRPRRFPAPPLRIRTTLTNPRQWPAPERASFSA